jgi:DNA methyltransferase 1-associated protein 1
MDPTARALTPHAAHRYFVTQHERLSSGVSFASDRLHRARSAKSMIQTEKISAILNHLRIPDIIPLPTQRVIEDFEKLMQKVHLLLDMRKLADKEEQEIRVKEAEKRVKEGKEGVKEEGEESKIGQKRSASVMSNDAQGATKRPKN